MFEHLPKYARKNFLTMPPVCSRCLSETPQDARHELHADMCVECGDNYELVLRLRRNLERYNPPYNEQFKFFRQNNVTRVKCPNCGHFIKPIGQVCISLYCDCCKLSFHQFNSGIVYARKNRGNTDIPYLTNDHLPYFDRHDVAADDFKNSNNWNMPQKSATVTDDGVSLKLASSDIDKLLNL